MLAYARKLPIPRPNLAFRRVRLPMIPPAQEWNALLGRVAAMRDRAAFAALFAHFAPRVKAYLLRLGASPAVAEDEARLRAALKDLPADQIQVIELSFFADKPHSKIAAELAIPLGTVKSRLRLAMARLKRIMSDAP